MTLTWSSFYLICFLVGFGLSVEVVVDAVQAGMFRSNGSFGWDGAFGTHFWVDPKRQIAAVIMMQVLPFYDTGAMKVYQDVEAAIGRNLR